MLPRERRLRAGPDLLHEEIVPAEVERIPVTMPHLMISRRVNDQAGDALRVEGPKAGPHDAAIEGPIRGHATGYEGVVVGRVDDGVSIETGERDTDHGKTAIIVSAKGWT